MGKLTALSARAKQIHESEGWASLVRRGFAFVSRQLCEYRTYYLSEYDLANIRNLNAADFMPKIDDFTLKVVTTNQEADELEGAGLEFRSYCQNFNARKALEKGAIVFCIFIAQELAAMGWVALTQQAMDSLNERPIKIDFSNKDAFTGGIWTNPKYRRVGLSLYSNFKRLEFQFDRGIMIDLGSIAKGNIVSQKAHALFSPRVYVEGRYLKILWLKSWRERPLPPS